MQICNIYELKAIIKMCWHGLFSEQIPNNFKIVSLAHVYGLLIMRQNGEVFSIIPCVSDCVFIQVLIVARLCRFKSCYPHQKSSDIVRYREIFLCNSRTWTWEGLSVKKTVRWTVFSEGRWGGYRMRSIGSPSQKCAKHTVKSCYPHQKSSFVKDGDFYFFTLHFSLKWKTIVFNLIAKFNLLW